MEQTYTLTCKFKDTENKSRSIIINNPKEDVTEDKILDFMNYVIDSEVLILDDYKPDLKYASISGVYFTTTQVEEISLV